MISKGRKSDQTLPCANISTLASSQLQEVELDMLEKKLKIVWIKVFRHQFCSSCGLVFYQIGAISSCSTHV